MDEDEAMMYYQEGFNKGYEEGRESRISEIARLDYELYEMRKRMAMELDKYEE